MRYGDRTDAELMASAQAGWAPAFAVLLHRHGPAVRSAVADAPDPIVATRDVFMTALAELPGMDPDVPVRTWLLDIAGVETVPDPIVPLREEERDAIWASLVAAWPGRRRPQRTGLRRVALVACLVALAALVPTLVVLAGETPERATEELRAHPIVDEAAVEVEPEDDVQPTPTFTFPSVSDDAAEPAAPQEPTVEAEPTAEPEPTATATPTPTPTTTATTAPAPSPTSAPPPPQETAEPEPSPEPTTQPQPTEPPTEPEPPADPDGGGAETGDSP
ncbi:RNA polymerase sigma factor [Egicoccus sp. AB-alg2]|uniref:RNA polymerase sigma factor n=1 Tax=Egicoccus sp. AB-alg2 TaxID=3242693 RepID=UPI00359CEA43